MKKEMSGYAIKQEMEKSTSNFSSSSYGSIYPILSKLEKNGFLDCHEVYQGNKLKKNYQITNEGRDFFLKWLKEPIDFMKSYESILVKVFFFRYLTRVEVLQIIRQLIDDLSIKIEELEQQKEFVMEKADYFEQSTLNYGIDNLIFTKEWYEEFLAHYEVE